VQQILDQIECIGDGKRAFLMSNKHLVCTMCKGSAIGEIGNENDEERVKNVIQQDSVIMQCAFGKFTWSGSH
jgi:hypothetical protein